MTGAAWFAVVMIAAVLCVMGAVIGRVIRRGKDS